MSTLYGKIEIRDRKVYVRVSSVMYSEPVLLTRFWRLACDPDIIENGAPASSDFGGVWRVSRGMFNPVHVRTLNPDGSEPVSSGSAQSAFTEEQPIPPPKARKGAEVRWSGLNGCWEKYSSRYGWRAA